MQDEGNEDDCDEEYANGLSVEALAQAAAALRRQSSGGSTGSNGEMKINWKQVNLLISVTFFICLRSFQIIKILF